MESEPASPWKLGGLSAGELAKRVWREMNEDEVTDRAAALSYYFVFALFPALLFLAALLGLVSPDKLLDRLVESLGRVLPADAFSLLTRTLEEVLEGARGSLLSLGAVAALWAASNGMSSVMNAFNVAYDAVDHRSWIRRRLMAVFLTLVFAAFTLSALVMLVFSSQLSGKLAEALALGGAATFVLDAVQWVFAFFLMLVGIGLVYYLAPALKLKWYWVTPGSVFAGTLWVLASLGLRLYVSSFGNYNATYGSIGGVILLLLWLYLTGLILLVGAEINSEIAHAAGARAKRA